jgi:hypothetical protein
MVSNSAACGCHALETEHIAVTDKSGAGKSNLIRGSCDRLRRERKWASCSTPIANILSEFFGPERGDVVLNPIDMSAAALDAVARTASRYAEPDGERRQKRCSLPRQADVGSTPFFRRSSRMLYLTLLKIAELREPAALVELHYLPRAELKQRLKGTPAEALIDPGAHEQGAGIVATVANAINPFRYLPATAATESSERQCAQKRTGWVSLTCEEATCCLATALKSVARFDGASAAEYGARTRSARVGLDSRR